MNCCKRSSSSSDSAAIVEGNEDLLIEIFLFMPAKPLLKFKAVSKKCPFFCCRHTLHCRRRLEKHHSLILSNDKATYHIYDPTVPGFIAVEFNLGFPEVEILQSCNGLLLLRCKRSSCGRIHYYVFNPSTSQPRHLSPVPFTTVAGIYLIFDPSQSPHYKVVCFEYAKTFTLVHLYDSETCGWKLGGEHLARRAIFHDGIYFNGGIYFLRFSSSSCRFSPDEGLTKIPPLPRLRSARTKRYLTPLKHGRIYAMESNGVLFFCAVDTMNVLYVYETKEIEIGWTKKYEVDMNPSLDVGIRINRVHLLSVVLGEKEEDSYLLVITYSGKLMIHRFDGVAFEDLAFRRDKEGSRSFRKAHHFIHSLAPL